MQKRVFCGLAIALLLCLLTACGAKTCHYCGKTIQGDALSAGGRYYCSYDHYWSEALFGG